MSDVTRKAITDYLLGKQTEAEEEDFLAECFSSDKGAEKFESARDDLIEGYLRGDLSNDDKVRFEKHFLDDFQHRELFEFAQTLRGHLKENRQLAAVAAESAKKSFSLGSWAIPIVAFGALVIGFMVWQFVLKDTKPIIVERKPTPTPQVNMTVEPSPLQTISPSNQSTVARNSNVANLENTNSQNTTTPNSNKPEESPAPSKREFRFPSITLAVAVKGEGKKPVLNLNKTSVSAEIRIGRLLKEYQSYTVIIRDENNNEIWKKDYANLQIVKSGDGKEQIVFNVPAEKFNRSGKYTFQLNAKDNDGNDKTLYQPTEFEVVREN